MNSYSDFWNHIERIPFSGCWIWTGPEGKSGYGRYGVNGIRHAAHRLAFWLSNGIAIKGKCVCHKCDVPSCINPDHLFLGTQQDNLADMRNKGRERAPRPKRGEDHYEQKLSEEDVRQIRASYTGKRGELIDLAKRYGVSYGMIGHIVKRRKWTHIQ